MSLIKWVKNALRKQFLYLIEEVNVPAHIQALSLQYVVINSYEKNLSQGEIRKFIFLKQDPKLRVGQALIKKAEDSNKQEIWINLGDNFYKLILKA